MGAATRTSPPSTVIWTVFLRRRLRRTSYSMSRVPKVDVGPVQSPADFSEVGRVLGDC